MSTANEEEILIPNFAYPFKRKDRASKTKSTQELYMETLHVYNESPYLFNKSGLFHGGVHLEANHLSGNFETDSVRAIADGTLVAYRIDETYRKNEVDGEEILYSSGFMLLKHEIEYPKENKIEFLSLYMHMAPMCQYAFEEYMLYGHKEQARYYDEKTKKRSSGVADVYGKKVTLTGEKLDGRYVVETLDGKTLEKKILVHPSNLMLEEDLYTTTTTGSDINLRYFKSSKNPSGKVAKTLEKGVSISIHPKSFKNRYEVVKIDGEFVMGMEENKLAGETTPKIINDVVTIHRSNITKRPKKYKPLKIEKESFGLVSKDMTTDKFTKVEKPIEVKAGDVLGKLGVYNHDWSESELDQLVHLEVFTFYSLDEVKEFIQKAKEEYEKDVSSLSEKEQKEYKKSRPKENQLYVKDDVERYKKEEGTFAKILEADWLRDKTIKNTKSDKTLNILKVNKKVQRIKQDAIVKINPSKVKGRYKVISVEEGDDEIKKVIEEDTAQKWSVWHESIEKINRFTKIDKSQKEYYKEIDKPLKEKEKLKGEDEKEYLLVDKVAGEDIYVEYDKKYFTHGITFSKFTVIDKDETSAKQAGIFKDIVEYYDPESQEKREEREALNPLFKSIFEKLKVDEDKDGKFEAGEFAGLAISKEKRKELSYFIVEHKSEWYKKNEELTKLIELQDKIADKLTNSETKRVAKDTAKLLKERVDTLSFFPQNPDLVFFHPIALVSGFVGSACYCNRDFTVEEVKNIVKELRDKEVDSKGRATVKISDGYNLFTKKTSIPDTDKTYERFTEELNKTMKKYEINTCIRKIHFLAQSYTESNRFRSTEEEGSLTYLKGKPYYPYYGRGLLQLTWKGKEAGKMGYKQYFTYLGRDDYETKYSEVGSDLEMVMDVSGYFWNRGKLLSKGKILKSKYANAKGIKKNFSKKRVSNPTLTTIDLNQVADDDNVKQVTYLVNGAQSHISERTKYTNFLKEIFDYETCVNKK